MTASQLDMVSVFMSGSASPKQWKAARVRLTCAGQSAAVQSQSAIFKTASTVHFRSRYSEHASESSSGETLNPTGQITLSNLCSVHTNMQIAQTSSRSHNPSDSTHPVAGVSKLCEHLRQVDEAVKVGAPEAEGTAHLGFVRRVPRQPHEGEPRLPACMHARSLET